LLSANDTLVKRIEDLSEGYALEDTCPRVQCRTTSMRLRAELEAAKRAEAEVERMRRVVDAAIEWLESWGCDNPDTKDEELALAISAMRHASSEQSVKQNTTAPNRDNDKPDLRASSKRQPKRMDLADADRVFADDEPRLPVCGCGYRTFSSSDWHDHTGGCGTVKEGGDE
jgi:hypothetical protein